MSEGRRPNDSTQPARAVGRRPPRVSGERLRLQAPEAGEPAPSLRQFARWMGYFGLRPGPHATWQRPLAPGSLGERLERARARLRASLLPGTGSADAQHHVRPVDCTDDDDRSRMG